LPELLQQIHDPPRSLFLRGGPDPEILARPAVAIVGARACSPYGAQVARMLGRELAAAGLVPAGSRSNLEFVAPRTRFPEGYSEVDRIILADAQTNGGLLAAVAPKQAAKLLRALEDSGIAAARIGEVREGDPGVDVAA